MSEQHFENLPLERDNEQAKQFYRTATNPQVLPKKYWPAGEVDFWDFNDAVIAQYEAAKTREYEESQIPEEPPVEVSPEEEARTRELAEEVYRGELARIACAGEYVQDVPLADISDAGSDNVVMQREGAREYVLKVARGGAREIKRILAEAVSVDADEPTGIQKRVAQENPPGKSRSLEVLSAHVDLEAQIKRLYQDHRLEALSAQSLILLFELQKSTASPERQIRALQIRSELERKILSMQFDRQSSDDVEKETALEIGIIYVRKIIGRPNGRVLGLRPYQLVKKIEEETGGVTIGRAHV